MWTKDAIAHYGGTATAVAKILDMSVSAVSQWGEIVPYHSAVQLHLASNQRIALEPQHYGKGGRRIVDCDTAAV